MTSAEGSTSAIPDSIQWMQDVYLNPEKHMPELFRMAFDERYYGDEKIRHRLQRCTGYVMRFARDKCELVSGAVMNGSRIEVIGTSDTMDVPGLTRLEELSTVFTIANQSAGAEWVSIDERAVRVKVAAENARMNRVKDPGFVEKLLDSSCGTEGYRLIPEEEGVILQSTTRDPAPRQEVWAWEKQCLAFVWDRGAPEKPYDRDGSWCSTLVRLTEKYAGYDETDPENWPSSWSEGKESTPEGDVYVGE